MAKSHYLKWNRNDTLASYTRHAIDDTVAMWPFARVYGMRYYFDYEYRQRCKRSFSNSMGRVRYGNNWHKKRKRFIEALRIRDGWGCNVCHIVRTDLTIDHIVPLFAGGPNTLDNVQLLCNACHVQKSKGENKRYVNTSSDKKVALASEAQKINAIKRKKAAMGTVQKFNEKTLRKSLLYLWAHQPRRRELANRALHTERGLRGLPTLRP